LNIGSLTDHPAFACLFLGGGVNEQHGHVSLASTGKYKVRGLVRNVDKAKEALGLSSADDGLEIEVMQGNISDEASLGPAMKVRKRVSRRRHSSSKVWNG